MFLIAEMRPVSRISIKKGRQKSVVVYLSADDSISQSQPLPAEKLSTPEFKNSLKVPEDKVKTVRKSLYKLKGSARLRKRKKQKRAVPLNEKEKQAVEALRLKLIAEEDASSWSQKPRPAQSQEPFMAIEEWDANTAEEAEVTTAVDYHMGWASDEDVLPVRNNLPARATITTYDSMEDLFDGKSDIVQRTVDDIPQLEERLSQLSASQCQSGTRAITPEFESMVATERDGFFYYEGQILHQLPSMRKSFPSSGKVNRIRVENLREHLRVLATGSISLEEDARSLEYQLSLVEELRKDISKEMGANNRAVGEQAEFDDLEVTSALVAVSIPSLNKLYRANQILEMAGYKKFASDRRVKQRLDCNTDGMDFSTKTLYVNDEQVNLAKVSNVSNALSSHIRATMSSLDTDSVVSKKLILRMGVDRGGGKTKVALSLANRKGFINSPFNWALLGIYNAKDNSQMLRETMTSVFEEVDNLQLADLKLPEKLEGHFTEVSVVLIGDMPSMSAVLGLKGPASKHPCPICVASKDSLHCSAAKRNYHTAEEKVSKAQDSHNCMPLLKNVTPTIPLLHAFMGPATTVFYRLQQDILKAVLGRIRGAAPDTWFDDSLKMRTQKEVREDQASINFSKKRLERILNSNKIGVVEECGQWCGQKKQKDPVCWKMCACGKLFHSICLGFLPSSADLQDLNDSRDNGKDVASTCDEFENCPDCGADTRIFLERITERLEVASATLKREFDNLALVLSVERGNGVLLSWGATCKRYNVLPGRYHGGSLTGNHVRNFLKNSFHFIDVLDDVEGAQGRVQQLKKILDPLRSLHDLTESRLLTPDEIASIPPVQDTLRAAVLETSWMRFTPKVHMICSHFQDIALEFGSVGLHSEQGLEHLHGLYTKEEKNFMQFQEPRRSMATALRLNALNVERLNNRLCKPIREASHGEEEPSHGADSEDDIASG